MRNARLLLLLAVVLISAGAFASPLFGTWKLDLNGQPVTVVVTNVDRHIEGKVMVGTGASAREMPMANARILDRPPSTLRFEVENFSGAGKTTFELHSIDSDHATLRRVGEGMQATEVKAMKQR